MTDCSPATQVGRPSLLFVFILAAFLVYAGAFVYKTSFVVEGTRYFCLQDDAMISMCYARNAANGHGLVWSPGAERVEGFTNPLWVLYMTALHLLPLPASKTPLLVQLTGVLCLALNLWYVKKIAEFLSPEMPLVWIGSVLLTAFYLPLNNWALQGMEVGLLTLLLSFGVWRSLTAVQSGQFPTLLYAFMGISLFVRIDMLVPCFLICVYLILADSPHRWRHMLAAVTALGLGLAVQSALRLWYYGDILPNTYYLKMAGYPAVLRIARGTLVFLDFVGRFNWLLFLLPLVLLVIRPDKWIVLPIAVFAGQVAYSIYTGGDAWEWWGGSNRFISLAMPLFFVLLCGALDGILRSVEGSLAAQSQRPWFRIRRAWRPCTMVFLIFASLLSVNALRGPKSWMIWRLREPTLHVRDNKKMVQRVWLIDQVTSPDAKVAVQWAGIIPYFLDRPMIDLLGKNDRRIAHLPMHRGPGLRWFHPGHLKWDLAYSIGQLQPDVIEQPWVRDKEEAEPWLRDFEEVEIDGVRLYLRKGSDKILERVSKPLSPSGERMGEG